MNSTITRSISGIAFLAIVIGSLLLGAVPFAILMLLCIGIMMREYFHMTLKSSFKSGQIVAYLLGMMLFTSTFLYKGYGAELKWVILSIALIPVLYISILFRFKENYSLHPYLFTSVIYIALPFSMINLIIFDKESLFSINILLSLFIFLWASDIGGYIFGMLLGQRFGNRLFPSISPKKSWIGYIGGLFLTLTSAIVIYSVGFIKIGFLNTAILAMIINIFSVFGDLSESQLKRYAEVKDSGTIMPGHGGLLDRFDGVLLSFPPAIIYLIVFTNI